VLRCLPDDTGLAIVFIQHLDPKHASVLSELLSRATRVHVIPPNTDVVQDATRVNRRPPMLEPVDKTKGQEIGLPVDEKLYGTPTPFSCPDCNGTLGELEDDELLRYRCRVGHA
jgi:chemotaxis response regulator CheB